MVKTPKFTAIAKVGTIQEVSRGFLAFHCFFPSIDTFCVIILQGDHPLEELASSKYSQILGVLIHAISLLWWSGCHPKLMGYIKGNNMNWFQCPMLGGWRCIGRGKYCHNKQYYCAPELLHPPEFWVQGCDWYRAPWRPGTCLEVGTVSEPLYPLALSVQRIFSLRLASLTCDCQ